jgi:hypothetical protein
MKWVRGNNEIAKNVESKWEKPRTLYSETLRQPEV